MSTSAYRTGLSGCLAALALVLAVPAAGEPETPAVTTGGYLTATYLGNEGVLLASPSAVILIDALFGDGLTGYETVPKRERRKLEAATAPYDEIDLVLATHYHGDHFAADPVRRHLEANPRAIFVSTDQAVAALELPRDDASDLRDRVRAARPTAAEVVEISLPFAALRVLHITHGARRPPVQNLAFLLEIDGLKILHLGDSEASLEDFRRYRLADERVDIAFVPFWYLLDEEGRSAVARGIAPRTVIPLHVPAADAPASYFGGPGGREELLHVLERALPNITAFQRPMRTRRFAVALRPSND